MSLEEGIKFNFERRFSRFNSGIEVLIEDKNYPQIFDFTGYYATSIVESTMFYSSFCKEHKVALENLKSKTESLNNLLVATEKKSSCNLLSLESIFYALILSSEFEFAKRLIHELDYALEENENSSWQGDKALMLIAAINDDSCSFINAYESYKSRPEVYIDKFLTINFDILKEVVENGELDFNKVKQSLENFKSLQVDKKMKKDSSPLYGGGDYEPFVIHFLLMVVGILASKKGLTIDIDDKYFPQEFFKMLIHNA